MAKEINLTVTTLSSSTLSVDNFNVGTKSIDQKILDVLSSELPSGETRRGMLEFADVGKNVCLRITTTGHIQTKLFNSEKNEKQLTSINDTLSNILHIKTIGSGLDFDSASGQLSAIDQSMMASPLYGKKIGIVGDSEAMAGFHKVPWAKYEEDRMTGDIWVYQVGKHFFEMIADKTRCILNNKAVSGTLPFYSNTDLSDNSVLGQLDQLDSDIDYLIVFTGTNGCNLKDVNGTYVNTLGDENSPILSADPRTLDSTLVQMTVCGATKWLIEHIYEKFPSVKLAFITPWRSTGAYKTLTGGWQLGNTRPFTTVLRKICPLYGVQYFDNETLSGINWQEPNQCRSLLGMCWPIVENASDITTLKVARTLSFFVKSENKVYTVTAIDSNNIATEWKEVTGDIGTVNKAYGDGLHISNANGHRYLSLKIRAFMENL